MSSSSCCEKNSHRGRNLVEKLFALASGEEAMHAIIGRKLARSTVRRTTSDNFVFGGEVRTCGLFFHLTAKLKRTS